MPTTFLILHVTQQASSPAPETRHFLLGPARLDLVHSPGVAKELGSMFPCRWTRALVYVVVDLVGKVLVLESNGRAVSLTPTGVVAV